jgi:hypothetical protein
MIYSRTNKKMEEIDNLCRKRIKNARQGVKQELNDAITKISQQYKDYYESELQSKMRSRRASRPRTPSLHQGGDFNSGG